MSLHWNVVGAVFKRNFVSYFSNPIGYLFITAFIWANAYFAFWHNDAFFAANLADLDQLSEFFPYLLLFFIPAITMSIWAEERRSGTEELLLTLPATDLEVVLGKYLSGVAIYTVALLFSALSNTLVLKFLGDPDTGLLFSTFLGFWLIGASLVSAGMMASLLTSSVTVAFIWGVAVCIVLVSIHNIGIIASPGSFLREVFSTVGVEPQFAPFGKGLISVGSVFYFVSIIVVMFYLNMVLLSRRHWAGSERAGANWFHYLTRAASILVAAVSVTILASRADAYLSVDATQERIHSLSPDTRRILNEIDPNRPVLIEAFISPNVPRPYVQTRKNLLDLLRQYDAMGGNRVVLTIHDTELFTPTARDAERVYDIKPQTVRSFEDARQEREDIFLGVAFKCGLNEKVIPFFYRGLPVEYELTRMVQTVSQQSRRKIGVLNTDASLFGTFNMQMMQPTNDWLIVEDLKQQYEVVRVSPDAVIQDQVDVLIVPMASSLTQTQLDNLIDYIKKGKPTLILDDPMPMINPRVAALEQKSQNQNMMFGGQPPPIPKGDLRQLTNLLNIEFDAAHVIWQDWNPIKEIPELPKEYVFVGTGAGGKPFNEENPVTSGLQELVMIYAGSIRPRGGDGPTFEPLLTTSAETGTIGWNEAWSNTILGRMPNPSPRRRPTHQNYVLAAYIHGPISAAALAATTPPSEGEPKPDAKPPEIRVLFVADLDMISDDFFQLRRAHFEGQEKLQFQNTTFILNCVDYLAGDESFVRLRKKQPVRRTLDRLDRMTQDVRDQRRKAEERAEDEAQGELEKAQKVLDDKVEAIRKRTDVDERTKRVMMENERQYEQRVFDKRKDEIELAKQDKVRRAEEDLQVTIRTEQRKIKLLAVLLPPIPALILGLAVFLSRSRGEREGVDPRRYVDR